MDFFDDFLFGGFGSSSESLKTQVDAAIKLFERGNIPALQQKLFEIYSGMNKPGGGKQIVTFNQKDKLGEIFTLCLRFDWMDDSDIREVWAEDGFYCLATYLTKDAKTTLNLVAGALDMFLLIHYGKKNLLPKVNDILRRASQRAAMGFSTESRIFDTADFQNGGEYLLREFAFFTATLISKVERQHPQIISSAVRPDYDKARRDFVFANVPADKIFAKMQFIARIIESILLDM